jgi:hypothetical protein
VAISGAAGNSIVFSFWVRTSSVPSAGTCRGVLRLFNGGTPVTTRTLNCPTGTSAGFVARSVTFTAPGAYTSARVIFTYSKAGGTVWFDLASLMR